MNTITNRINTKIFSGRKILIVLIGIVLIFSCNSNENVYIFTDPYSVAYHQSKNCQGLNKCSTELTTITIKQAKEMGRRICGYED